ncbi:T9SS type A sorting domain-containing protein [uncultured Algibacter sp.]|uniref:T9SS type A sorting domain-containing protein n=1 Tax=uncultured Algibacter sp. TaxID=298659 RepID=UPI002615570D|nr:T9SS type A sorting domain-containing protein [uncultured Algibacter sp.]
MKNIMYLKLDIDANYAILTLGKVISNGYLMAGENQINVTNLTNGIYFLKVKSILGDLTRKVLKK